MKAKELDLDVVLRDFTGTTIVDPKTAEPIMARGIMLGTLGAYPGKDDKNKFLAFDLGIKIAKHEGNYILLESTEHGILLDAVRQNGPGYLNLIHVQVLRMVEGAKEVEVEAKQEEVAL